jgi:hypothetical protein
MVETDDRHLGQAYQAGALQVAVPGKYHIFAIDNYWVEEAELPYAGSDLPDLFLRMRSRISGVGAKPSDRNLLDTKRI